MKRLLLTATAVLLSSAAGFAADGKAVFDANGCAACHDAKKEMVGPPLSEIAAKYAGKKAKADLAKFLEGKAKPKVDPKEFAVMKPNLQKTEALSKEDRAALADFILGHK